MSYPQTLLPHPGRKQITCDLTGRFLIRQTMVADPADLKDPHTGEVKVEYLCQPREQLTDLSTSLLGVFTPEHNRIKLIGENKRHFGAYCPPNDVIDPVPVLDQDYEINETVGYVVLPIDRLNGLQVPFKKGEENLSATCRVLHTSARWNYWHYSVRWNAPEECLNEQEPKTLKKKWAQNLLATARHTLCTFADTALPAHTQLDRACYEIQDEAAAAVAAGEPAE